MPQSQELSNRLNLANCISLSFCQVDGHKRERPLQQARARQIGFMMAMAKSSFGNLAVYLETKQGENPAHQHAGPPSRLAYNQPHHAQENIKQIRLRVDFSLHAWSGMVVKYHHFAHHIDCSNHIETLPVPEGQNAASVRFVSRQRCAS